MLEPKTITLLIFITILLILVFYPFNYNIQNFSIKKNILSKTDVFAKHMLLNDF